MWELYLWGIWPSSDHRDDCQCGSCICGVYGLHLTIGTIVSVGVVSVGYRCLDLTIGTIVSVGVVSVG